MAHTAECRDAWLGRSKAQLENLLREAGDQAISKPSVSFVERFGPRLKPDWRKHCT